MPQSNLIHFNYFKVGDIMALESAFNRNEFIAEICLANAPSGLQATKDSSLDVHKSSLNSLLFLS
jgi:hypothetical protein